MTMNNNPFIPGGAPVPGGTPQNQEGDFFEVDLTNVSSGYTIPEGEYKVRCLDVEQGISKAGNPQYIWSFVVLEGENAGFELKVFTAITPAALWKLAETVEALGVGQTGQVVKFKRSDVIGKECKAEVVTTSYNGQDRSNINKLMKL